MPRISEKARVEGTQFDRRVKLKNDQKAEIRWIREEEQLSYSKIAKKFGVSKRLIIFICKPEKMLKCKEQFKERRKDRRYYDRESHKKAIKDLRDWKEELYKQGKIKLKDDNE